MSWWLYASAALGGAAIGGVIAAEFGYWRGFRAGQVAAWYGDPLEAGGWPRCGCCERPATTLERGRPLCERHRAVDPLGEDS